MRRPQRGVQAVDDVEVEAVVPVLAGHVPEPLRDRVPRTPTVPERVDHVGLDGGQEAQRVDLRPVARVERAPVEAAVRAVPAAPARRTRTAKSVLPLRQRELGVHEAQMSRVLASRPSGVRLRHRVVARVARGTWSRRSGAARLVPLRLRYSAASETESPAELPARSSRRFGQLAVRVVALARPSGR